jgi:peptide/nickel transport system permease protein
MIAYVVERLSQALVVMLAVALISFGLFRFVGDPVASVLGLDVPQSERERLRADLGLDRSLAEQFGSFVARAATGNFGLSYQSSRPVVDIIGERLPATLELAVAAALLAVLIGIPVGIYTALRRESALSRLLLIGSLVGVSLPTFVIGILLILVFSVVLGWLPSFGRGEVVKLGWWSTGLFTASGLKALILPAVSLALVQLTFTMRLVRAAMLEVLRTDYIKFAHARGLTRRAIHYAHALRNTLVPVITVIGLNFGTLVAFAIVTETVFQWPGMGQLFIQSVSVVDAPVLTAFLLLVSALFVLINLAVDLMYFVIDPRIRASVRS